MRCSVARRRAPALSSKTVELMYRFGALRLRHGRRSSRVFLMPSSTVMVLESCMYSASSVLKVMHDRSELFHRRGNPPKKIMYPPRDLALDGSMLSSNLWRPAKSASQ